MKILRIGLSVILLLFGAAIIILLIANAGGIENVVGDFLFASYSFMAYTVPLFFFYLFYIVAQERTVFRSVTWTFLALFPFFFLSLSLRTFLWNKGMPTPPLWGITQLFDQNGAGVFWIVLATGTILLLSVLYVANMKQIMNNHIPIRNPHISKNKPQRIPHSVYIPHPMQYQPQEARMQSSQHSQQHTKHRAVSTTHKPIVDANNENVLRARKNDAHLQYASYPTGLETEDQEQMLSQQQDSRYLLLFHRNSPERKQMYYTEYERELMQDNTPIGAEGYTAIPINTSPIKTNSKESLLSNNNVDQGNRSSTEIVPSNSNNHDTTLNEKHDPKATREYMQSTESIANRNFLQQTQGRVQEATQHQGVAQSQQANMLVAASNDEIDIFGIDDMHITDRGIGTKHENSKLPFLEIDEDEELSVSQKELVGAGQVSYDEDFFSDIKDNVFDEYLEESELDGVESSAISSSSKKMPKQSQTESNGPVGQPAGEKDVETNPSIASKGGVAPSVNTFSTKIDAIFSGNSTEDKSTHAQDVNKLVNTRDTSNTAIQKKKKNRISEPTSRAMRKKGKYFIPISGVLNPPVQSIFIDDKFLQEISQRLEVTLQEFNVQAKVMAVCRGPVVTLFEVLPASGVRIRRIVELGDNIALRLAAPSVRIVSPIPGKEAVGIEIPNKQRDVVSFSELISQSEFHNKKHVLPIALGKNILAETIVVDLAKTPHMLIAGATGSGKSVCINSIICSLLYSCDPEKVKLILIDPKIVELSFYNNIPHLLTPVISDPVKSMKVLNWCVEEMERRYVMLEQQNVREIEGYNKKLEALSVQTMSYLVIVIDEFADLMMTGGKEIETLVSRITAKSRAVGIHLVIATQRPSTNVITGLIKSNVPTRISFMVASKIDSRIILDVNGAEKLLGKGDMLYSSAQHPFPDRLQGAYLEEEEVERVVEKIKQIGGETQYMDESLFETDQQDIESVGEIDDPLWDQAVDEVIQSKRASASHLQRRFKIGYNRAARLIDDMEYKGIIGSQKGAKQREILVG